MAVLIIVAIKLGNTMSVVLPRVLRIAIIVVGISCIEVEFITTSIILFFFILIFSIALIPAGVPALPIPSIFADKFIDR